jgi:alcohol dehydrogenase (cytochrome c)
MGDAASPNPPDPFNTGQDISASPMTYAVDGQQYVSIAAGSDVFSFSLPK